MCFIKVNVFAPSSVYSLLPPCMYTRLHVFAFSMLLRCMLNFKRLACGIEDVTQCNTSPIEWLDGRSKATVLIIPHTTNRFQTRATPALSQTPGLPDGNKKLSLNSLQKIAKLSRNLPNFLKWLHLYQNINIFTEISRVKFFYLWPCSLFYQKAHRFPTFCKYF